MRPLVLGMAVASAANVSASQGIQGRRVRLRPHVRMIVAIKGSVGPVVAYVSQDTKVRTVRSSVHAQSIAPRMVCATMASAFATPASRVALVNCRLHAQTTARIEGCASTADASVTPAMEAATALSSCGAPFPAVGPAQGAVLAFRAHAFASQELREPRAPTC